MVQLTELIKLTNSGILSATDCGAKRERKRPQLFVAKADSDRPRQTAPAAQPEAKLVARAHRGAGRKAGPVQGDGTIAGGSEQQQTSAQSKAATRRATSGEASHNPAGEAFLESEAGAPLASKPGRRVKPCAEAADNVLLPRVKLSLAPFEPRHFGAKSPIAGALEQPNQFDSAAIVPENGSPTAGVAKPPSKEKADQTKPPSDSLPEVKLVPAPVARRRGDPKPPSRGDARGDGIVGDSEGSSAKPSRGRLRDTHRKIEEVMERLAPVQGLLKLGIIPENVDHDVWTDFGTIQNGKIDLRPSLVKTIVGENALGRGLFACKEFAVNETITIYGGELITDEEARRRRDTRGSQSHRYLMRISDSDFLVDGYQYASGISVEPNEDGVFLPSKKDATMYSQGAGPMANHDTGHGANASIFFVPIARNEAYQLLPRIPTLKANRRIEKGEEIKFNYGSSLPFCPQPSTAAYNSASIVVIGALELSQHWADIEWQANGVDAGVLRAALTQVRELAQEPLKVGAKCEAVSLVARLLSPVPPSCAQSMEASRLFSELRQLCQQILDELSESALRLRAADEAGPSTKQLLRYREDLTAVEQRIHERVELLKQTEVIEAAPSGAERDSEQCVSRATETSRAKRRKTCGAVGLQGEEANTDRPSRMTGVKKGLPPGWEVEQKPNQRKVYWDLGRTRKADSLRDAWQQYEEQERLARSSTCSDAAGVNQGARHAAGIEQMGCATVEEDVPSMGPVGVPLPEPPLMISVDGMTRAALKGVLEGNAAHPPFVQRTNPHAPADYEQPVASALLAPAAKPTGMIELCSSYSMSELQDAAPREVTKEARPGAYSPRTPRIRLQSLHSQKAQYMAELNQARIERSSLTHRKQQRLELMTKFLQEQCSSDTTELLSRVLTEQEVIGCEFQQEESMLDWKICELEGKIQTVGAEIFDLEQEVASTAKLILPGALEGYRKEVVSQARDDSAQMIANAQSDIKLTNPQSGAECDGVLVALTSINDACDEDAHPCPSLVESGPQEPKMLHLSMCVGVEDGDKDHVTLRVSPLASYSHVHSPQDEGATELSAPDLGIAASKRGPPSKQERPTSPTTTPALPLPPDPQVLASIEAETPITQPVGSEVHISDAEAASALIQPFKLSPANLPKVESFSRVSQAPSPSYSRPSSTAGEEAPRKADKAEVKREPFFSMATVLTKPSRGQRKPSIAIRLGPKEPSNDRAKTDGCAPGNVAKTLVGLETQGTGDTAAAPPLRKGESAADRRLARLASAQANALAAAVSETSGPIAEQFVGARHHVTPPQSTPPVIAESALRNDPSMPQIFLPQSNLVRIEAADAPLAVAADPDSDVSSSTSTLIQTSPGQSPRAPTVSTKPPCNEPNMDKAAAISGDTDHAATAPLDDSSADLTKSGNQAHREGREDGTHSVNRRASADHGRSDAPNHTPRAPSVHYGPPGSERRRPRRSSTKETATSFEGAASNFAIHDNSSACKRGVIPPTHQRSSMGRGMGMSHEWQGGQYAQQQPFYKEAFGHRDSRHARHPLRNQRPRSPSPRKRQRMAPDLLRKRMYDPR